MSSHVKSLRVVNLHESTTGVRVGVARAPVIRDALSINIETVKNIARYAGKIGVKTLILPPFLPLGACSVSLSSSELINVYGVSSRSPFVRIIRQVANTYSLNIIVPYIIEVSRGKHYISNLFVHGSSGTFRFFSRKLVLSDHEERLGFTNGSSIDIVGDDYLGYSVLIDHDTMYPEIARLVLYMGGDLLLVVHSTSIHPGHSEKILISLSLIIGLPLIYPGYTLIDGESLKSMPAFIVISEKEVYEFNDDQSLLITIPIKSLKQSMHRPNQRYTSVILDMISKYSKRVRLFKG